MKRPLIDSGPVSEFGASDPSLLVEEHGMDYTQDLMYVPGFSDQRQQRERELAEYRAGTRLGQDIAPLAANVRWTRRASVSGVVDSRKLMGARNVGWRPVTKDMIGTKPYLTGMGSGWNVLPDGTITIAAGDLQLMYLEGAAAASREVVKLKAWTDQVQPMATEAVQTGTAPGTELKAADGKSSVVDFVRKKLGGGLS
jgi:hypothetical protein